MFMNFSIISPLHLLNVSLSMGFTAMCKYRPGAKLLVFEELRQRLTNHLRDVQSLPVGVPFSY